MNRSVPAWIGAAVLVAALAQTADAAADKVIVGKIQIPEVSGVAFLPGDRLLVVADDPFPDDDGHSVFLLKNASQHLQAGDIKATDLEAIKIDADPKDLEDVAWDRGSNLFLVTSQTLNRRGEEKKKRRIIVRLSVDDNGITVGPSLALEVPPEFGEAKKRTAAQVGLNIEGAAWSRDGHLLLGLRAPTSTSSEERSDAESNEDAILLDAGSAGSSSFQASASAKLQLNGNGIRGMFYDPDAKGLWILAGLSPDLRDGLGPGMGPLVPPGRWHSQAGPASQSGSGPGQRGSRDPCLRGGKAPPPDRGGWEVLQPVRALPGPATLEVISLAASARGGGPSLTEAGDSRREGGHSHREASRHEREGLPAGTEARRDDRAGPRHGTEASRHVRKRAATARKRVATAQKDLATGRKDLATARKRVAT